MKTWIPALAVVCLAVSPACASESTATESATGGTAAAAQENVPESFKERLSYIVGANLGRQLAADGLDVDLGIVTRAIQDMLDGKEMPLSQEVVQATMQELQSKVQEKQMAAGKENQEKGEAFLAANKSKEGVVTLDNGLQYKIITEGSGEKPTATSRVTVHYTGTLVDGTKFDSSRDRGTPATFGVGQVIPGWTQILQMMPVGSRWEVYIPSELGYGPQAPPGSAIGPNSALVFDVELLGIEG